MHLYICINAKPNHILFLYTTPAAVHAAFLDFISLMHAFNIKAIIDWSQCSPASLVCIPFTSCRDGLPGKDPIETRAYG